MNQPDLFDETLDQQFEKWVHTPGGGWWANLFIRLAWKRKKYWHYRVYGAKAIYEDMRWHYRNKKLRFADNGKEIPERIRGFKLNNNMVSRLARFAEERCPYLKGLFKMRELKS